MKEELTRETVEKYLNEARSNMWTNSKHAEELATALLEEMDKPKLDVWKNAPEWATLAEVLVTGNGKSNLSYGYRCQYTRELPKTRARQIAEEVTALVNRAIEGIGVEEVEAVLNKYAEELERKE